MSEIHDRVKGVLLGLACGDKIGGPVRMAIRVAESLVACRAFDPADVLARYLVWWQRGGFDTGPTAAGVFERLRQGWALEAAVQDVDRQVGGMTAGVNPAHRNAPLAMAGFLADEVLAEAAQTEARLTHAHPLAGDVAAAVVRLCRALIRGLPWAAALDFAAAGRLPETQNAVRHHYDLARLSRGGFAPEVLRAALYFLEHFDNFPDALEAAVDFAGSVNYCPILVGSVGGARWGLTAVQELGAHPHPALSATLHALAEQLAATWHE
ncbi:ADP-ribosylglycohydrolase family protein [uncultured Thermanaerothrix sp.]|uniref:ADP-ribosylglycohydrolase family protein n=1 Tax=uncultured Thermanaerothrix sp. TaxID=1195149 RepID=UPI002617DEB0|nr:ADP-ribosylglycohydrolase family protein [uncultured Thermanaerothrix sp.]